MPKEKIWKKNYNFSTSDHKLIFFKIFLKKVFLKYIFKKVLFDFFLNIQNFFLTIKNLKMPLIIVCQGVEMLSSHPELKNYW